MTGPAGAGPAMSKRRLFRRMGIGVCVVGLLLLALGRVGSWPGMDRFGYVCVGGGLFWWLWSSRLSDEPMRPAYRRYLRQFIPAMIGYVLAIVVFEFVAQHGLPVWTNALAAILPALPMVWVVVSMWRLVRDMDELERRIQLEAIYLTCGIVGLLSFVAGMLEQVGVIVLENGLILVLPAMFGVYGLAGWFCRRKYGFKGMC